MFNPAGRPVGALILWLKNQKNHDTQVKHVGTTIGSYNDRKAAREWFKTLPGADAFLALERPREPGETEEPRDIRWMVVNILSDLIYLLITDNLF